jgi:hypothetical protein
MFMRTKDALKVLTDLGLQYHKKVGEAGYRLLYCQKCGLEIFTGRIRKKKDGSFHKRCKCNVDDGELASFYTDHIEAVPEGVLYVHKETACG